MFRHILVPVDFTERNQQAIDIAIKLAKLNGGVVSLLHVIEMIEGTTLEEFKSFYTKLERSASKKLAGLLSSYQEQPLEIRQQIVYGERSQEILRYANEQEISLIVMSSHAINPATPTKGWGTISHKVGILATCPVLLVK